MLGSRMEELCAALVDAFVAQELRELLKLRLDKDLAAIVPAHGAFGTVVFELINLASRQGWLPDLVLAACDARPRKPALQVFRSDQDVLAAKLGHIEDRVNEQQKLINRLVETSMSAAVFRHLTGITILHEYKYWQNAEVGDLWQREFYYLKDRGFIGPERQEFFREMDGINVAGKAVPTEIGIIYIKLRKGDVPKDWLSAEPSKRRNLKVEVARGLGLEVPG